MSKFHLKAGDTVVVITGKDKGKKGKIISVEPKSGKIVVEKINMVIRHSKPRRQTDIGGRLDKEAALYASKVMRVCPKCGKPTRIGRKVLENGEKSRYCKQCQEIID